MEKALSFPDITSARVAFALAENVRFRCSVCGRTHLSRGADWRLCADLLAHRWGLHPPARFVGRGTPAPGEVRMKAIAAQRFLLSLADVLREPQLLGLEYGSRTRHRFPEPVPGLYWPDVLAVEAGAVADAVRTAWQGWWRFVLRLVRETACLARRYWLPGAWEQPVPVTEALCAFLGELLQAPAPAPRDVIVGCGAVACRARDAKLGRVINAVAFSGLGAVVRAECPEEVAGLVPGLERFAEAAGGTSADFLCP